MRAILLPNFGALAVSVLDVILVVQAGRGGRAETNGPIFGVRLSLIYLCDTLPLFVCVLICVRGSQERKLRVLPPLLDYCGNHKRGVGECGAGRLG